MCSGDQRARLESTVVRNAFGEESRGEGRDAGARFGRVRGHGGAGGDDGACDVGADYRRVVVEGREAVVALVVVDWIEGDGFDFEEEVVGTWGGGRAVGDLEDAGGFGGENGG